MRRSPLLAGLLGLTLLGIGAGPAVAADTERAGTGAVVGRAAPEVSFPVWREPSLQDPFVLDQIRARLAVMLGDRVKIKPTGKYQWRLSGRGPDMDMAEELILLTLADVTWSRLDGQGRWMPDLARLRNASVPGLEAFAHDRFGPLDPAPRAQAEAVLAYVQALPYRVPEGGYITPDQVLERGYGDCDSKAVLAAALLQSLQPGGDVRFVVVGDHVLLAADLPLSGHDQTLIVDDRPFVLLEPSGRGFPAGNVEAHINRGIDRGAAIIF